MNARGCALLGLVAAWICSLESFAATSDLYVRHTPWYAVSLCDGVPGNIVWNGQYFVTASVRTNGNINLVFIDSAGLIVTNRFTGINGSAPRLAAAGSNYVLAWTDTNLTSAPLVCTFISNDVSGAQIVVATNAVPESVVLREANGQFLVLWESTPPNSTVWARWLGADAAPAADPYKVSPSVAAQRNPSVNMEGTNYLVCWMEQNSPAPDWRVLTRFIAPGGPLGAAVQVSETNSLKTRGTACSFGTNYLVAWSADNGPYSLCEFGFEGDPCPNGTNLWFAMVHGRMVNTQGDALGHTLTITRARGAHTNVALAFGEGRYFAFAATGWEHAPMQYPLSIDFPSPGIQVLRADGTRDQFAIPAAKATLPPRLVFGDHRLCALSPIDETRSIVATYGNETVSRATLPVPPRWTNGPVPLQWRQATAMLEYSTNLIDWSVAFPDELQPPGTGAQMFFRAVDTRWQCAENLRAIQWAKEQWALDQRFTEGQDMTPTDGDLFGPGKYLPAKPLCPQGGSRIPYQLNAAYLNPMCPLAGHVIEGFRY